MTAHLDGIPGVDRRHRWSDFYHERTNFNFLGHSRRWLTISTTLMVISLLLVAFRGLNFGIDFEGGVSWQVKSVTGTPKVADVRDELDKIGQGAAKVTVVGGDSIRVQALLLDDPVSEVRDAFAEAVGVTPADITVDATGGAGTWSTSGLDNPSQQDIEAALREVDAIKGTDFVVEVTPKTATVTIAKLPQSPLNQVTEALAKYAGVNVAAVTINTVGPTWGAEVSRKAAIALVVFFLVLALYLWLRFELRMAVAAIVAVIHDIIFTVGAYALFQFEVTPATVTAFLTILGFSLYDTVVVFDKIKENERSLLALGKGTYTEMANRSLNQVLMRSLSTSVVALLPVMSLLIIGAWALGATSLEDFGLALAAGLFVGSYSSIFVATPLLAVWKERDPVFVQLREKAAKRSAAEAARPPVAERLAPAGVGAVSSSVAASATAAGASDPGRVAGGPPSAPADGTPSAATWEGGAPRPRRQRRRKPR